MKSVARYAFMLLNLLSIKCGAQNIVGGVTTIPSTELLITTDKTTNLIFSGDIISVDRGSEDVLVQQPSGTKNIIQVKAGEPHFKQTNLSVITDDGQLYSFTVDYSDTPKDMTILVGTNPDTLDSRNMSSVIQTTSLVSKALLQQTEQRILQLKPRLREKINDNSICLQSGGVYVVEDVIYFRLMLYNKSNTSYDVDAIKFVIKNKRQSKRTAMQERELIPAVPATSETIDVDSAADFVIAFPKFSLSDSQFISVKLTEKDGDRNLLLPIPRRRLMHANRL